MTEAEASDAKKGGAIAITIEDGGGAEVRGKEETKSDSNDDTTTNNQGQASLAEVFSFVTTGRVKLQIVGAVFSSIISGLVMPAMVFYFAAVFEKLGGDPNSDDFMKNIREVAFSFMILGVIAFTFLTLQATLMETAAGEMTNELKKQWFRALLRQDMAYYDIKDVSAQATIIANNGRQYRRGVGSKLVAGIQFFITFVGGMIYAFVSSWRTSLTVLATVPFMTASLMLLVRLNSSATARKNESYAKAGSIVTMSVSSIRTILSLNAVQVVIDKYSEATQEAYKGAVSQAHLLGFANGSQMASMLLSYIPVVLYGSYIMYSAVRDTGCDPSGAVGKSCDPAGKDVFGALMGITVAASVLPQVSVAIEAITGARVACYPAIVCMNRQVGRDSDSAEETQEGTTTMRRGTTNLPKYVIDSSSDDGLQPSSVVGNIEFKDVKFGYPTRREVDVFDGFTLNIEAGKTVALVGPSGSGKSTATQLLLRFYDPALGSIKLDGNDLKSLNVKWLRKNIGLVKQEPTLFDLTIAENIRFGCPDASQEEIEEAARKANAHDFISEFPDGYNTNVGDKGTQLSGGQKQRIAIATAILKKTKILILDEATSALDSESEMFVQEALDGLMGGCTTLVIAHRLSTIRNADLIAVVDGGRIVETGKHEELLAKQGKYFDLVESQKFKADDNETDEAEQSMGTSTSLTASRKSSFMDDNDNAEAKDVLDEKSAPVLQFRDVHFSYPSRQQNTVFQQLNLSVHSGETLALVGPSGMGKSTVIQLLEAFYRPTKGSVEFLGVDMKDINVKWMRNQIGLVGQEPDMFDLTVAENIRFGCDATQQEVEQAAKQANAHDFISEFPDGYDTRIGEGGAQVSGGERQRMSLARCLVRKPRIILLDEATSALDSESEKVVQEALNLIMADPKQTTVVVAHRLSTIRNADRIAVIDHGRVREIGTHDELMAKPDGQYRRLQAMQNLDTELQQLQQLKDSARKSLADPTKEEDEPSEGGEEEEEIDASKAKSLASRSRLLGNEDWPFYIIGGIGAIMSGFFFPAFGFVFADMIEVLYFPVPPCYETAEECSEDWNDFADTMRDDSFNVFYQVVGLICIVLVGNVLLFYGFGTASEKMNKRVRDAAFQSLVRQEIAWFDVRSDGAIVSQLEEDAAMLQAFAGQPIRTMALSLSSVLVGLIISFVYMWPFALIALGILPFMSFGAEAEMKMYMGEDEGATDEDLKHSSSQIALESISNIRTVASLTMEEARVLDYSQALKEEDPTIGTNFVKGSTTGLGQFIQFWGLALMFWWGGWLLSNHGDVFTYRDYLISMFGLFFSLYGLALAAEGMVDKEKAKRAAVRIFDLIDRQSQIDPLSEEGLILDESSKITAFASKAEVNSIPLIDKKEVEPIDYAHADHWSSYSVEVSV